ncbi:MAG: aldolase catalytic domain-containing protein [Clostridia bacterium]|nr:aldolase catalytic domain-containing protein [Clostridia bacterium]
MKDVMLLDCTLRDGGYVNDWKFGRDNIVSIFERVVDAGIDIIEIGFLDERRTFDPDRSIMPDTDCVDKIYGDLDRGQTMVVGMIDFGTCSLEHIRPASECFLDGIRVIFKKHLRETAMAFCGELKALGYKVFAQLVSVTSYDDAEMLDLIRLANAIQPFAVSIVDTYGLMHQDNLMHYFDLLNDHLDASIALGYHAHNNFQMGYANCIAVLNRKMSCDLQRPMLVDGSIYGMGKSAGNAPIELIAMYMNHRMGTHYGISQILESIDSNISSFYQSATWGYNMFYYLAASNDCHPNYVSYLMQKQTLSIKSINDILARLQGETKLLYDKNVIEQLYQDYQKNEVNDADALSALGDLLRDKPILLVGPGSSMKKQKAKVSAFYASHRPVVISINRIPEYLKPDYIFLSNSKRYVGLATRLARERYSIIATSNVTGTSPDAFDYVLNFGSLMDKDAEFVDNSLAMFLKVLVSIGVREVTLAGFDGYSVRRQNYADPNMEYDFVKQKAAYLNEYMRGILHDLQDRIHVSFLTDTLY